ncbi:MAG: GNAT family N-acetyltransferase [Anaerolineaceae bacterium]
MHTTAESALIIRFIEIEDINAVAAIHQASFHDRALTQLGPGSIKRYYYWLLTGFSDIFPLCVVDQKNNMLGYCFSGIYAGSFSGFLKAYKWYLMAVLITKPWLIFNSIVADRISLSIRTLLKILKKQTKKKEETTKNNKKQQESIKTTSLGILSIAVNPNYQRQGVGELLMREVECLALANGYSELHLSVEPENIPATKFYEKLGWYKIPSDSDWNGQMAKNLI